MDEIKVGDLMIPVNEYATVSENATLQDAINALEEAQKKLDSSQALHRAILVYNESNHISGKISKLDILRALEPKYASFDCEKTLPGHFSFSHKFIKSMFDNFNLWDIPLTELCKTAAKQKVKDFMYTPAEGEFVNKKAHVSEAIHHLVSGHHQSLLVVSSREIVGILRLTDVFEKISETIKSV